MRMAAARLVVVFLCELVVFGEQDDVQSFGVGWLCVYVYVCVFVFFLEALRFEYISDALVCGMFLLSLHPVTVLTSVRRYPTMNYFFIHAPRYSVHSFEPGF